MKKEISLIISKELVELIKQQQEFVKASVGEDWQYLFCETKNATDQLEYETEHYPMEESNSHEVLNHLMESSGTRQADLVNVFPSKTKIIGRTFVDFFS